MKMETIFKKMSGVFTKKDYDKVNAIIEFMEEHGEITPKEAKDITKKSAATVRRYFKMLVDTGYIVAVGSTNNVVYRVSMDFSFSNREISGK